MSNATSTRYNQHQPARRDRMTAGLEMSLGTSFFLFFLLLYYTPVLRAQTTAAPRNFYFIFQHCNLPSLIDIYFFILN
jgi:hypothetical protein